MPIDRSTPNAARPWGGDILFGVLVLRVALTGLATAGIALEYGFYEPPVPTWAAILAQVVLMAAYWADVFIRTRLGATPVPGRRPGGLDLALLVVMTVGIAEHALISLTGWSLTAAGGAEQERTGWIVAELAIAATFLLELWRLHAALSHTLPNPGVLFPLSFLVMIAIGTLLLKAPVAVPPGERLSWLDAIFTMTSAVCITGLTVRDTATGFTPYGHAVIIAFVQLGGLGLIIFGSTLAMLLGRGISLRGQHGLREALNNEPVGRLAALTRFMLLTTLGIELVGAAALYLLWDVPGGEVSVPRRIGVSLFHAVSAFCNAGFDLTGESLAGHRDAAATHLVIAPLIVAGGLGFPVLYNLAVAAGERARSRLRGVPADRARARLTLHTKLVLVTSASLYLYGVGAIGAGQFAAGSGVVTSRGVAGVLADASFLSVTARSGGLTTVPIEEIEPAGRFALMTLMLVGGSPGGTAGGIKTTTLALLVLSVVATIRQRREAEAFGRSISDSLIRRAATVAICYVLMLVAVTFVLTITERAAFHVVMFEAVSAASTTGLSLGLTPELTPAGRVVIIAAMFLGRVGPLALFAALVLRPSPQRPYAYAHEPVALG